MIPDRLRGEILETLHAAHQGVSGMINRAEQSVFWPHITTDIEKMRAMCRTCVRNSPSQPAGKPVPPPSPSYPFQMLATDYCHLNGVNYLVIVDRYSGWLSILHVGKGEFDTEKLIEVFRDYFLTLVFVKKYPVIQRVSICHPSSRSFCSSMEYDIDKAVRISLILILGVN